MFTLYRQLIYVLSVFKKFHNLRHAAVLRSKIDSSALDLAVEEVSVGAKDDSGSGEHPGKSLAGGTASRSSADGSTGCLDSGKEVVDVIATRGIGVHDVHVLLTAGRHLVGLSAELVGLGIVVSVVVSSIVIVVVTLLHVLARHAVVQGDNGFAAEWQGGTVVLLAVDIGGGLVDAAFVVEDTKEDGLAVFS